MMRFTGLLAAAAFAVVTAACSQTDGGITTKIKAEMAQDDMVKANDINVTTRDHVVTLTGTVDTPAQKEQAIRIARAAEGVTDVVDELRVGEARATTGAREAADELGDDIERGADKTGDAIERGADNTKNVFEKAADATVDGAKKVGSATATGAKKVGSTVKEAVTDDDPDSDNDGK